MVCTVGEVGWPEGIFALDGILSDLRCLSVVVMLGCSSGITVLILATDGLLHVHVASDLGHRVVLPSLIEQASSERMLSTLVKAAGARTLTVVGPHMLVGNMWVSSLM